MDNIKNTTPASTSGETEIASAQKQAASVTARNSVRKLNWGGFSGG